MSQPDLFEPEAPALEYEVHYLPPAYPKKLFPSQCKHPGPYAMIHDAHIVPKPGCGNQIAFDHKVCFGCGCATRAAVGGNVLVDLHMLWQRFRFHAQIGARILYLRERWGRLATYLFDEDGWNGRHERIARMIDPRLTMRLSFEPEDNPDSMAAETGRRVARISFDREYLRDPEAFC